MAETTKYIRDAAGNLLEILFWDFGSGQLAPINDLPDSVKAVLTATQAAAEATQAALEGTLTAAISGTPSVQVSGSSVAEVHGADALRVAQFGPAPVQGRRLATPVTDLIQLITPTYDGSGEAVHPSVVHTHRSWNGYEWWMALTPYAGSDSELENPSILASNDGITWVEPPGITNPIEPSPDGAAFNADPELVFAPDEGASGTMYIYWTSSVGTSYRMQSTDGVTWTDKTASTGFNTGGVVRRASDDWVLFTDSTPTGDGTAFFGRRTSSDGLTWTVDTYMPMPSDISKPWHISVLADQLGYHFLCGFYGPQSENTNGMSVYYGYSQDGYRITWDSTPLFIPEPDSWNSQNLYRSCLVPLGKNTYRAYISGRSTSNEWHIGYADVVLDNPQAEWQRDAANKPLRTVETVYSGSVAAGGDSGYIYVKPRNETAIWVAVTTDQQPWELKMTDEWNGIDSNHIYPRPQAIATAYTNAAVPWVGLLLPSLGVTPTSLTEALLLHEAKGVLDWNTRLRFYNQHATEAANVTIRILRVYK